MVVLDVLFTVVAPVMAVALVGGLVGRRIGLPVEPLSRAVFTLFSPALVFSSLSSLELAGAEAVRLVVVAAGVFTVNAVLAVGWGLARGTDRAVRATTVLGGCVVNHGNMGLPIAALAFGDEGLRLAVVVFVAGVVLWSSAGIALAGVVRGTGTRRQALVAPLRYPSLYAAAAGVVVNLTSVPVPALVAESARTLGQASIPCMLVVLGLQFRMPDRRALTEPLAVAVNRLVVGPLAAWGLAGAVGLSGLAASTAVLQSGMPAAVMSTILARELDARPDLAVNTVLVTTLVSVVTLTVLVAVLR